MSFISVLDNIGSVFQTIFKTIVPIATDIEPYINAFVPAPYAALYDEAVSLITMAESAFGAAAVKNSGPAKMALVVSRLHPKVVAKQAAMGIAPPTLAQTQAFAQSVVDGLKAYAVAPTQKTVVA